MSRISLAALALLLAPAALAQTPIAPGDAAFAALTPQSTDYAVYVVAPMQQEIGSISSTERLEGDRLVMTSTVTIPMAGQMVEDSTVVMWPSLEPVYHHQVANGDTTEMTFADGQVTGTVDVPLPEGVFGPGTSRTVIRSVPFEDGYAATVSVLTDEGDTEVRTLTVTGQEDVDRLDGTQTASWLVEVSEEGAPPAVYAIDAATREIIEIRIVPQPGVTVHFKAR